MLDLLGVPLCLPPFCLYPCCTKYVPNRRGCFFRQFHVLDLICFILSYEDAVYVSPLASLFVFPCMRYFVSHSILNHASRLVTLQNVYSIYRRIFIMFGFPYPLTAARFQRSYVNTLTVHAAILPRPRNVDILGISFVCLCSVLAVTGDRFVRCVSCYRRQVCAVC